MNLEIGTRISFNDKYGTVTRIHILNIYKSCEVLFDDGLVKAFFGNDVDNLIVQTTNE